MKQATIGMLAAVLAVLGAGEALAHATPDAELVGLWEAKRYFGPEVRGELVPVRREGRLVADIAGFAMPVISDKDSIRFELPDQKGTFRPPKEPRRARTSPDSGSSRARRSRDSRTPPR